ncbi:MAG: 2-phospho-L-lactate transferase CofD family protein, partial [Candidatus Omnitrophota bacterium]
VALSQEADSLLRLYFHTDSGMDIRYPVLPAIREEIERVVYEAVNNGHLTILFVCTQNAYRSALMHLFMQEYAVSANLTKLISVTSGGTAIKDGEVFPGREDILEYASDCGVSKEVINDFRRTPVTGKMVKAADLIFVADNGHRLGLDPRLSVRPKVFLATELLSASEPLFGEELSDILEVYGDVMAIIENLSGMVEKALVKRQAQGALSSSVQTAAAEPIGAALVYLSKNIIIFEQTVNAFANLAVSSPAQEEIRLKSEGTEHIFHIIEPIGRRLLLARETEMGELFIIKKLVTEEEENEAWGILDLPKIIEEDYQGIYHPVLMSAGKGKWAGLEEAYAVVYPYINGESWYDFFLKYSGKKFSEYSLKAVDMLIKLARVCAYLEERGVPGIWDINDRNIIVTHTEQIVLIDYLPMRVDPIRAIEFAFTRLITGDVHRDAEKLLAEVSFVGIGDLDKYLAEAYSAIHKKVLNGAYGSISEFLSDLEVFHNLLKKYKLISLIRGGQNFADNRQQIEALTLDLLGIEHAYEFKPTRRIRAVVTAAGQGSRMGISYPKVLCEVGGKPIISYILEIISNFAERIVVVVRPESWQNSRKQPGQGGTEKEVQKALIRLGFYVHYAYQGYLKGDGHAVLQAKKDITIDDFDGDVLVVWGDMAVLNFHTVLWLTMIHQALVDVPLSAATTLKENPYAPVIDDEFGRVIGSKKGLVVEKGRDDVGLFIARARDLFDALENFPSDKNGEFMNPYDGFVNKNGELNFVQVASLFSAQNKEVVAPALADSREYQGVNTEEDLARAKAYREAMDTETARAISESVSMLEAADILAENNMSLKAVVALVNKFGMQWATKLIKRLGNFLSGHKEISALRLLREVKPEAGERSASSPVASQELFAAATYNDVDTMQFELSRSERKVMIVGGGSATNFFSQVVPRLGWQMIRTITPFDTGGRTGIISDWLKKHRGVDIFGIGDFTKALVEEAIHSAAIQRIMNTRFSVGEKSDNRTLRFNVNRAISELYQEREESRLERKYVIDSQEFREFITEALNVASWFDNDFSDFDIDSHSLRHLMYLEYFWLEHKKGKSYQQAVEDAAEKFIALLGVKKSSALLSSLSECIYDLVAETEDGRVIEKQHEITRDINLGRVSKLRFDKGTPQANSAFIDQIYALKAGDVIIFGPGSFYTSVICNLLPQGVINALARAKERGVISIFAFNPIYCNETYALHKTANPFVEMVRQVEAHANGYTFDALFDYCFVNNSKLNGDNLIRLMSTEGSRAADIEFTKPGKIRRGVITGSEGLAGYFKQRNYNVTIVSGDLMTALRTDTGKEASYDPEKCFDILSIIVRDHARGHVPEVIVLSDPHSTIDGLLSFRESLPGRPIFVNGDMIDRGDEFWTLTKLVDYFTLGDHELWAIGACLGHDYLLALWLRLLYRYPMATKILDDLGIDTIPLIQFSRKKYSREELDRLEHNIKSNCGKYKGPKHPEERALLNIWIKIAVREARRLEAAGYPVAPSLAEVAASVDTLIDNGLLDCAELTISEEQVFGYLKREFLRNRRTHEHSPVNLATYLLRGRAFQIIRPLPDLTGLPCPGAVSLRKPGGYRKAMLLHANIPMDALGRPVDLCGRPVELSDLSEYLEDINKNLSLLQARWEYFLNGRIREDDFWNFSFTAGPIPDPSTWLMLLADSEYSPLYARKQTRVQTYFNADEEPDNIAYAFLTRNWDADRKKPVKAQLNGNFYAVDKLHSVQYVENTLRDWYGITEEDLHRDDESGAIYIANASGNRKIAHRLAKALGVDYIILGHISRSKEVATELGEKGRPVSL